VCVYAKIEDRRYWIVMFYPKFICTREGFHLQTPLRHFFLEKRPPHLIPSAFFFPLTQVTFPFLSWQRSLVAQGPGLVEEQVDLRGRVTQVVVQHTDLGVTVFPASHCSPASTFPFPQTALAAPEEKLGGGGTTADLLSSTISGV